MTNFNKNIEFCRQALLPRMSRPSGLIAIYPLNTEDTTLSIRLLSNATSFNIRYIAASTSTYTITYVNKSIDAVVQEINALNVPIKAIALASVDTLRQGDLLDVGGTYSKIPDEFPAYERLPSKGIIIRGKKVIVRHKSNSSIKILPPYVEDPSVPWYPRISNGAFTQKYKGKVYHFYIAEYDTQDWSVTYGKPFKDVIGIEPLIIDKGIYKVPRTPIYWNGENIILYNKDLPISQKVIEDIDVNNGLLYTSPSFYIQDGFTIDYSYLENSYVYKEVNINGHFSQNPLMLDKFVVIYLLPIESNYTANKRTVFHSVGDSIEDAIASIKIEDTSIPIAIIGAYNIQQVPVSDRISILDTRSKGGGLISNIGPTSPVHYIHNVLEPVNEKIEDTYDEAYRFWDIGNLDGIPYPGAAAVAIEIPDYLQEILPIDEIKKRASKFLSAGIYPSIHFFESTLPSVTGISSQVSCTYNLDIEEIYTKYATGGSVLESIADLYTGAGIFVSNPEIPRSILSGDWASIDVDPTISKVDGKNVIEVSNGIGITIPYLKSTAIAGLTWKERSLSVYSGSNGNVYSFTPWQEKFIYDNSECASGRFKKGHLSFEPETTIKQYSDISIHSPYIYTGISNKVEEGIQNIYSKLLSNFNSGDGTLYGTTISEYYSDATDTEIKASVSDYVLIPSIYTNLYNISTGNVLQNYYDKLHKVGYDAISSGIYTSGHYFKYYIQNIDEYREANTGQAYVLLEYNNQLTFVANYLKYRRESNTWSGECDSAKQALSGVVSKIVNSAAINGIPFTNGIPGYWVYYPNGDILSGLYIPSPADLGSNMTEVRPSQNYDYAAMTSMPHLYSTLLAYSGEELSTNFAANFKEIYDVGNDLIIDSIEDRINATRNYSGLPTTSHWYIGHNKLGQFLGSTLQNLIKSYEYLSEYNSNRTNVSSIYTPSGVSLNDLNYVFSGIERCLEAGYDATYNNILRGGIVEPDIAKTIAGYGWYLNNWNTHYGRSSVKYNSDFRDKYSTLFDFGLKQLIKNQVNEDGLLLETTSINNTVGSFSSTVPSKILYPIAEAIKYDHTAWRGISELVINSIIEEYSIDGLYYTDPFKNSSSCGKELDVLPGLQEVYKALNPITKPAYEPISVDFEEVRGTRFLPEMTVTGQPAGWKGIHNSLNFWKYYNSGEINHFIHSLKGFGINTIGVDLDFLYWKYNSGDFNTKLDHLLDSAYSNKMRVVPTLFSTKGTTVFSGEETNYISYGATGDRQYNSYWIKSGSILSTSYLSGSDYVNQIINILGDHPSILGVTILDTRGSSSIEYDNFTGIAGYINTLKPDLEIGLGTTNLINSYDAAILTGGNIDYVEYKIDSLVPYFIDNHPIDIDVPIIYSDYGDGALRDYRVSIEALDGKPYIVNSIYVKSGTNLGALYENNTCRNSRQVSYIQSSATDLDVTCTGVIDQVIDFTNKAFYLSGYLPDYSYNNLYSELSSWEYASILQSENSGEYYRKILLLSNLQSGIDTLNYRYCTNYIIPTVLTEEECAYLNYYRTEWDAHNIFTSISNGYQLSGELDKKKHDDMLYGWGQLLNTIVNRLSLNG